MTHEEFGNYFEAESLLEDPIEQWNEIRGPYHHKTLTACSSIATLYQKQGKLSDSETMSASALEQMKKILGDEHPHYIYTLGSNAILFYALGFEST